MKPETFFDNFEVLADAPNGVQKLREMILQLAVRGKLVPQISSDKPTELNHQHISFTLPHGWIMSKLGDVLEVQNGYAFKSELFTESDEGIPLIRIRDLKRAITEVRYSGEYPKEFVVNTGDYLIGMDGDFEIHKWNGQVGLLNQRICRLRNFSHGIEPEYIRYSIQEKLDEIHANTSFVTVKHLSSKQIKAICLPIPPLEEQKRIISKIYQLMSLCDELEVRQQKKHETRAHLNSAALDRLLAARAPGEFAEGWRRISDNFDLLYDAPENVGTLRQAILQLAVMGKLVEQDEGDEPASVLFGKIKAEKDRLIREKKIKKDEPLPPLTDSNVPHQLPSSWQWISLGEVIDYNSGQKVAPCEIPKYAWMLDLEDIEKDTSKIIQRLTAKDRESKSTKAKFGKGDVLYGKLRPYLNKVVVADADGFCTTEIVPLRIYYGISPKYLMYALKRPDFLSYVNSKTYGVKMPRLGTNDARSAPFPLPPLAEQRRIVARVDQLMSLCDNLEAGLLRSQADGERLVEAVVGRMLAEE